MGRVLNGFDGNPRGGLGCFYPEAGIRRVRLRFQILQRGIICSVLTIPSGETRANQFMVEIAPVWQDHLAHSAAVPAGVPHDDLHLSAERLTGFRTVDSPQPDALGLTGVHHFDGVAVRDGDNLAGLAGSARARNCGAGAMASGQNCRNGTEDHQNECQKETVTKVCRHRGISRPKFHLAV